MNKTLKAITLAVLLPSQIVFGSDSLPRYCQDAFQRLEIEEETGEQLSTECFAQQGTALSLTDIDQLASSIKEVRSKSLTPSYTNQFLKEISRQAMQNMLNSRYDHLDVFEETLKRKNYPLMNEPGMTCANQKGLTPYGKKAYQAIEPRPEGVEKYEDIPKYRQGRQDIFFKTHLRQAILAKPWIDNYKSVVAPYKKKIAELTRPYQVSRYCMRGGTGYAGSSKKDFCAQKLSEGKEEERRRFNEAAKLKNEMDRRLAPLNEIMKGYPALFNISLTGEDPTPSDLMKRMLDRVESRKESATGLIRVIADTFETEKYPKSDLLAQKSKDIFEQFQKEEDVSNLPALNVQAFNSALSEKDDEDLQKIALSFKNDKEVREAAIKSLQNHAKMLDSSIKSICDREKEEDEPIIHQLLGLTDQYFMKKEQELLSKKDPSREELLEFVRLKAAHCELLSQYPDQKGLSTAGKVGMAMLGVGALAWVFGPVGLITTAIVGVGMTGGGLMLTKEGIEDAIYFSDKADMTRGLAHQQWATWRDYDKAYVDNVSDRNFNVAFELATAPFLAFDLGAIRQFSKATRLRSGFSKKLADMGENTKLWDEVSGSLNAARMIDLQRILEGMEKTDRAATLLKMKKMTIGQRKLYVDNLKLLELKGIAPSSVAYLNQQQIEHALDALKNPEKFALQAEARMMDERKTRPKNPVFITTMEPDEYKAIQDKYFKDIYTNPIIDGSNPDEYDLAVQILILLERNNPGMKKSEISDKFAKLAGECRI